MVPEPARVVSQTSLHGTWPARLHKLARKRTSSTMTSRVLQFAVRSAVRSWCARSARGRRPGFAATSRRRCSPGRRAGRFARGGASGRASARRWSCPGRAALPARPRAGPCGSPARSPCRSPATAATAADHRPCGHASRSRNLASPSGQGTWSARCGENRTPAAAGGPGNPPGTMLAGRPGPTQLCRARPPRRKSQLTGPAGPGRRLSRKAGGRRPRASAGSRSVMPPAHLGWVTPGIHSLRSGRTPDIVSTQIGVYNGQARPRAHHPERDRQRRCPTGWRRPASRGCRPLG